MPAGQRARSGHDSTAIGPYGELRLKGRIEFAEVERACRFALGARPLGKLDRSVIWVVIAVGKLLSPLGGTPEKEAVVWNLA